MVKQKATVNFKTAAWPEVVDTISTVFRFTDEERKALEKNETACLIAAIPFLADCRQSMRTAVSHVAIYHIARAEGKEVFLHEEDDNDNIMDRLFEGSHFNGGDHAIIDRGMNLLALQMIRGYRNDWHDDIIAGKYNPVTESEWKFTDEERELIWKIEAVDCPEMDAVLSVDSVRGLWDGN